jgi:hypothetical protein
LTQPKRIEENMDLNDEEEEFRKNRGEKPPQIP